MAPGRPREFDPDAALSAAMDVFWRKGYDGTTMTDLCAATGLRSGSIYAAYGSKLGLFEQVVQRYLETVFAYAFEALHAPTAAEVVRAWLNGSVAATTGESTPPGCLIVQAALTAGESGAEAAAVLADRRRAGERLLADRFRRARAEGDLPPGADPAVIANYVLTVAEGIAVQAATGATRTQLQATVNLATAHLPWL